VKGNTSAEIRRDANICRPTTARREFFRRSANKCLKTQKASSAGIAQAQFSLYKSEHIDFAILRSRQKSLQFACDDGKGLPKKVWRFAFLLYN